MSRPDRLGGPSGPSGPTASSRARGLVRLGLLSCLAAGLGAATGCAPSTVTRYDRETLADALAAANPDAGLVVGEFPLKSPAVVDGDTIKVEGIDGTLRLLAIDTEETFKSDADRRAYDEGFEAYLAKKQGDSTRPIKAATPLGMDAKHWAEDFFEGVRMVRLERDHPKELRGRYGRLLTYVMVERDGQWLNYNVECVRAGMSPYFTKYGYSRRFHQQFEQAQAEAQKAKRGIWDPEGEHYRDYDLRVRWWNARAEVIQRFEEEAEGRENYVVLTHWDAFDRLAQLEGREVVVLAAVGDIRPREGSRPARVMLSRRMFSDFPLIFFDDQVLESSGVEIAKGEYVRVTGTVTRYEFRSKRKRKQDEPPPSQLQIQIRRPEQVSFVDTRPDRIVAGYAPRMPPPAEPPPVDPDAPPVAPEPGHDYAEPEPQYDPYAPPPEGFVEEPIDEPPASDDPPSPDQDPSHP